MDDNCKLDGCDRPRFCKGWCNLHYERVRRAGEPGSIHPAEQYSSTEATCVCGQTFTLRTWGSPKKFCSTRCRSRVQVAKARRNGYKRPPTGPCSVEDCTRSETAKTLCAMHYTRLRENGDVGEAASRSHGGEWRMGNHGYVQRYIDGANQLQHRFVMEQLLGRPLESFETVHHLNGVRDDNRPQNLELWTKPQVAGQRVEDLVVWVVDHYPDQIRAELAA